MSQSRFITWLNSLPVYGDAGQGFRIMLWEKKNNGKFKQYPETRYHVGSGRTARVYTDSTGKQYVIGVFVCTGSNIYVSNTAAWTWLDKWRTNEPANNVENTANNNFQKLSVGSVYAFWRELDQSENPFLMIYPSEEAALLQAAGFGRIPFDGNLIEVTTGKEPLDGQNTNTSQLEQREAPTGSFVIIGLIAFTAVAGIILLIVKK